MKKRILSLSILLLIPSLSLMSCDSNEDIVREFDGTKENKIGEVSLFSFNGDSEREVGTVNLGHAYISVKNTSSSNITVGYFTLEPNKSVTVGSWIQTCHNGMLYNIEKVYMELGRYQGRISLTTDITLTDLQPLSEYILKNDRWTFSKNCSYHATKMFNTVANDSDKVDLKTSLITPSKLYKYINAINSSKKEFDKVLSDSSENKMYFYDKDHMVECVLDPTHYYH